MLNNHSYFLVLKNLEENRKIASLVSCVKLQRQEILLSFPAGKGAKTFCTV